MAPPLTPPGGICTPAEYGDWLDQYEWTHTATLTNRRPTRADVAVEHVPAWVRSLEQRAQGPVGWVAVAEQKHHGEAHLHVVLYAENLTVKLVERAWRRGHTEVELYRPGGRWAYYVAKTLGRPDTEWRVGDPRHLRRRV